MEEGRDDDLLLPCSNKLGRLEKVDLRTVWLSEASDFTPWLADDDNIELLGKAIGLEELEVEAREQHVGEFNADILCKDGIGNWVLIENQLERTDHSHLGQLLTYAAGLKAVTVVWIAQQFREEHRAALDWLNTVTGEEIGFFGVEVELWRIGNSEVAPKFNVVSKPNNWGKRVTDVTQRIAAENLTGAKQLQLEYWTDFGNYVSNNSKVLKPTKALAQHWMNLAVGSSECHMNAKVNTREKRISAELIMAHNAKEIFHALKAEQVAIESAIGLALEWRELPENKQSYIVLSLDADPYNKQDWATQHKWLCEKLDSFYRAFSPRLKTIRRSFDKKPDLVEV